LAVTDLEAAITMFRDVLGFTLMRRHHIKGEKTGMLSAELELSGIKFVLCKGTEAGSQVSQLVEHYGVGVAHIAFEVDDVDATVACLKERGLGFDTNVIRGAGLTQSFSTRCGATGLSFEVIHREGEEQFLDSNIQQLFEQLESSGKY